MTKLNESKLTLILQKCFLSLLERDKERHREGWEREGENEYCGRDTFYLLNFKTVLTRKFGTILSFKKLNISILLLN